MILPSDALIRRASWHATSYPKMEANLNPCQTKAGLKRRENVLYPHFAANTLKHEKSALCLFMLLYFSCIQLISIYQPYERWAMTL